MPVPDSDLSVGSPVQFFGLGDESVAHIMEVVRGEPLAAIVTKVHRVPDPGTAPVPAVAVPDDAARAHPVRTEIQPERTPRVNLVVFTPNGATFGRQDVVLHNGDGDPPAGPHARRPAGASPFTIRPATAPKA